MSNINKIRNKTRTIASLAIFSALYAAFRIIPTVPMVGTAATFSLSDILASLFGILLGPYVGGLSIALGTFAAMGMGKAPVFFGLDFLPAFVNAVALGFLIQRKWWQVVVLNIALLLAFIMNPLTLLFVNTPIGPVPFVWLHLIAFIVLLSPLGRKSSRWIETFSSIKITVGFAILAFVGTMMQHLTGNILYEVVLGQITHTIIPSAYSEGWKIVFYLYPLERLALVVLATAVGVPVVRILKKSFFPSEHKPFANP